MPELHVHLERIGRNAAVVSALVRRHGLDLVGVTKGCLGEPRVAGAMLEGGAVALADTRDLNLRRLEVTGRGAQLRITAEADGYLYKMVRSLVGALVAVGQGIEPAPLPRPVGVDDDL